MVERRGSGGLGGKARVPVAEHIHDPPKPTAISAMLVPTV